MLDIPVRVERPVMLRTERRAEVQNRHPHSDLEVWREVCAVRSVEVNRATQCDSRQRWQNVKWRRAVAMALGVQGSPFFECAGRYQRLACEHGLCARAIDRDDYKLVPSHLQRRKITVEGETRLRAIGIARLYLRDIGTRDAVE